MRWLPKRLPRFLARIRFLAGIIVGVLALSSLVSCVQPQVAWQAIAPQEVVLAQVDQPEGETLFRMVSGPGNAGIEVVTRTQEPVLYTGLILSDPTWDEASQMGPDGGLLVRDVQWDVPSADIDIEVGDVITHLNGIEVSSRTRWEARLNELPKTLSALTLTRRRGLPEDSPTTDVLLRPEPRMGTEESVRWLPMATWASVHPASGLRVAKLPEECLRSMGGAGSLIVVDALVGSPSYLEGIRPGDRLHRVEDIPFDSLPELWDALEAWRTDPEVEEVSFAVEGVMGPDLVKVEMNQEQREPEGSQFIMPPLLSWDSTPIRRSWNALFYLVSHDREWLPSPSRDTDKKSTTSFLFRLIEFHSDPQDSGLTLFWFLDL